MLDESLAAFRRNTNIPVISNPVPTIDQTRARVRATSASGPVLQTLRSASPEITVVKEPEFENKLKPANYLVTTWDILLDPKDQGWPPEIYQIGMVNPHGQKLLLNVQPSESQTKKPAMSLLSYVMQDGAMHVRMPHTNELWPCRPIKAALEAMTGFLSA